MNRIVPAVLLTLLLFGAMATAGEAGPPRSTQGPADSPIGFSDLTPAPGSVTSSQTPRISAAFTDRDAPLNPATAVFILDGTDLISAGVEGVNVSMGGIGYTPASVLRLATGPHNVTLRINDTRGNSGSVSWNFTVNPNATGPSNPLNGITPAEVILYVGMVAGLAGAGVGGYILFLRQTTRFTFRRYFAIHKVERKYLTIYIPLLLAFLFTLVALAWVFNTRGLPALAADYVFVGTSFVALTAYGIDARREMLTTRANERAFAQFLFEMADAMRGGIDPAKAIVELAKTHTDILRKPLRIASDAVLLGRPFDSVLRDFAAPLQSRLITRYASLIADATSVGGEIATVIYRAAKDMDDFVKIEIEREKQLYLPVAVIYIAFGVLMAVLFALLYIAPSLGSLNVSFLGFGAPLSTSGGKASAVGTQVPKLAYYTLKERFFDLMFINALGTGAIIGAFTEGRARYGILHSLALTAGTLVAFLILFP